jgi:hypothetical protein
MLKIVALYLSVKYFTISGARKPSVSMPANLNPWIAEFDTSLTADLVGSLADQVISSFNAGGGDQLVLTEPVIVATENFNTKMFSTDELAAYTPFKRGRIFERIVIPVPSYVSSQLVKVANIDRKDLPSPVLTLAAFILAEVFDKIYAIDSGMSLLVEDIIYVRALCPTGSTSTVSAFAVEWEGTPVGDMAADSIVGMLTEGFSAPSLLLSLASDLNLVGEKRAHPQTHDETVKASSANMDRIERMRSCLIDPSKAHEGLNLPTDNSGLKKSRSELRDKLEAIQRLLESTLNSGESSENEISVLMNALGDRLIVRRADRVMPAEAYCMFEFSVVDDANVDLPIHHVVVKSENAELRQKVIEALKEISSS